jgi:hypothetical protein
MKTLSKILNQEFEFSFIHIGLFLNDDLHLHDKWIVIIEGQEFEYSTGIGHRINSILFASEKYKFSKVMNKQPKKERSNMLLYLDEVKKVSKVKPLNLDDILYCLILDADCGTYSFDDFCSEFGYDDDSIKATEIYKACQKNGKKVKKFIPNIEEARELFQDY